MLEAGGTQRCAHLGIESSAFRQLEHIGTEAFAHKRLRDFFHHIGRFVAEHRWTCFESRRHLDRESCNIADEGGVVNCHF